MNIVTSMETPVIPYPFYNLVDRAKEGQRRYGTLENSGEGEFECRQCGKRFISKEKLDAHIEQETKAGR